MTKDVLIESFLSLGTEKGFQNVSVQEVADKAGVKKASVFYYYKTFDELKKESISFGLNELSKNEFVLKTSFETFTDFLYSFFDDVFMSFSSFPVKPVICMAEEGRSFDSNLRSLSEKFTLMLRSRITVSLDFAQQKGWIQTPYTDSFAEMLTPFVKNLILSENQEEETEEAVRSIMKILK